MKSLMLLLEQVLIDMGTRCSVSTARDLKTISSRVEEEGLSFLTITLPTFSTGLQKALANGCVDHNTFPGFRYRGGLPQFLGGFLDLIFDRSSGSLLQCPSEDAVFSIRQITMLFGKLEGICTPAREKAAIQSYMQCEREVKEADAQRSSEDVNHFRSASARLFGRVLSAVENDLQQWKNVPKHGPGKTADRLSANQKYTQCVWTDRLETFFPAGEFLIPNWRFREDLDDVTYLEPRDEIPAKLVSVPKTLKTPRLIAIEPTAMQYTQQSLSEILVSKLESRFDNDLPNLVGFTDQTLNRELARRGSSDGSLATLDLSEASDRVSNQLVRDMTYWTPVLSGSLQACRSRKVDVPGFGVVRLAKFASMGSAVCFPIEAMVFATICLVGIERQLKRRLHHDEIISRMKKVRIYGDDIIVPAEYALAVVSALQDFGLVVNTGKSFWTGKFRESCGGDFYNGVDVTPVRVRRILPTQQQQAQQLVSAVSLRNQLYLSGSWRGAAYLDSYLARIIPLPRVSTTSAVLGRVSHLGYEIQRVHPTLHSPLVKGVIVKSRIPESNLDGYGALMKFFLRRGVSPTYDKKHLQFAGRPDQAYTKVRWASPF
jgi:hypothetical protein